MSNLKANKLYCPGHDETVNTEEEGKRNVVEINGDDAMKGIRLIVGSVGGFDYFFTYRISCMVFLLIIDHVYL